MTVTSIIRVPEVGEVGVKATFRASGEKAGTELRYYLAYAPVSSALNSLATVTTDKRSDAKLQVDATGAAYFTPDVPGHYQVEVHDVTVVSTPRKYADAPNVPDTDNDFGAAPVVNLNTAEGRSRYEGQADFVVLESLSRVIGQGADTATVKLYMHEAPSVHRGDGYALEPSSTSLAKLAQYDPSVRAIGDLFREGRVTINTKLRISLWQALPGEDLLEAIRCWNRHLGLYQGTPTNWRVHDAADGVNVLTAPTATDLASAITRLLDFRAKYDAHRVRTASHGLADTSATFPAGLPTPTDLLSALVYFRVAWQVFVAGPTEVDIDDPDEFQKNAAGSPGGWRGHLQWGRHGNSGTPADPNADLNLDFPSTLDGLVDGVNQLAALYEAHRVRVNVDRPHSAEDTNNTLPDNLGFDTKTDAELAAIVNAWAKSIERHTADTYIDGTGATVPLASAIHQNTHPIQVGLQAGNPESTRVLFEACCNAMQKHILDGGGSDGAHVSPSWGGAGNNGNLVYSLGFPAMTRMQKHWALATSAQSTVVPSHMNERTATLRRLGWKLRHDLPASLCDEQLRVLARRVDLETEARRHLRREHAVARRLREEERHRALLPREAPDVVLRADGQAARLAVA